MTKPNKKKIERKKQNLSILNKRWKRFNWVYSGVELNIWFKTSFKYFIQKFHSKKFFLNFIEKVYLLNYIEKFVIELHWKSCDWISLNYFFRIFIKIIDFFSMSFKWFMWNFIEILNLQNFIQLKLFKNYAIFKVKFFIRCKKFNDFDIWLWDCKP